MTTRWVAGGAAASVALASYAALTRRPPGGRARWVRTNHRGRDVTLLGGPAVAAGALAGAVLAAPAPALLAGGGAAALGLLDDLTGATHARGFRGHLAALRRGEVTTGTVKLAGIGVCALAAAAAERRPFARPGEVLVDAALIAGCANLVNLLDLRPGRALKATAVAAAALSVGAAADTAAAPLGAAVALLPFDVRERTMVGDCGANGLGALLGLAVTRGSRPTRLAVLAGVVGLTAASERVSFSAVIDRTPLLAALDRLGRRPA